MSHERKNAEHKRPLVRITWLAATFTWGWYILANFRTTDYGPPASWWTYPFVLLVFVLPLVVIATLGMPWRRSLAWTVLLCLLTVVSAEGYAGIQEARFRRACLGADASPHRGEVVFEDRWWPFEHHFIYYDPTTERFAAGD